MKPRSFESSFNEPSPGQANWLGEQTPQTPEKELGEEKRPAQKPEDKPKKHDKTPKKEPEKPALKEPNTTPDKTKHTDKPEKTRQEKHTELVERSLAYKKQFEDIPVPRDPVVLARLMVADHVLALNEQLEHPEKTDNPPPKSELLAALDYMGELNEKFEDPTIEATPHIEETYETILQLADSILQQEENIDTILTLNHEAAGDFSLITDDTSPEKITITATAPHPKETSASPTIGALIATLLAARSSNKVREQPHTQPLVGSGVGNVSLPSHTSAAKPHHHTVGPSVPSQPYTSYATSPSLRPASSEASYLPSSPLSDTHNYRPASSYERPLVIPARSSTAIASLALASAIASPHTERHAASPGVYHSPASIKHESAPVFTPAVQHTETVYTPSAPLESGNTPQRKIEHMPLQALLSMADAIPVGYGNYLRRAFEKGQIDKDGLVKILKSHARGNDFIMEYRQQAARYQHLKSSPEFLRSSPSTDNSQPSPDEEFSRPESAPVITTPPLMDHPTSPASQPPVPEHPASAIWEQQKQAVETPPWPKYVLWFAGSIVGIGILVAAIASLF